MPVYLKLFEGKSGKKIIVCKSSPSNLLIDKTTSVIKLIIFVLSFVVKNGFPNINV